MGMKLRPLDSSMLRAVGYDETSRELRVIFKTGETYSYLKVPNQSFWNCWKQSQKWLT